MEEDISNIDENSHYAVFEERKSNSNIQSNQSNDDKNDGD